MFHPSVTSLSHLSLLSQSQCHLCFTPVSLHCHNYLYCHSHNVTYVSPQCHFIVTIISTVTVTMSLMFHPSVTSLSQLSLLSQSQCHLCFTPVSLHCHNYLYCHSHNVTYVSPQRHFIVSLIFICQSLFSQLFLRSHSCTIPVSLSSYPGVTIVTIIFTVTVSLYVSPQCHFIVTLVFSVSVVSPQDTRSFILTSVYM